MHEQNGQWLSFAITAAVIGIVLFFRIRRMRRTQRLRLERLWIVPALILLLTSITFWETPPVGIGWLWAAVACAIGAALGWQRGRAMRITLQPETGELCQTASPLAFLMLLGLIALRTALRSAAALGGATWHLDAALVTDLLVALALGLLSAQRLEMFLRGRRLLAEAAPRPG